MQAGYICQPWAWGALKQVAQVTVAAGHVVVVVADAVVVIVARA